MVKIMSNSDVLRCLAKNIIYRPVQPGEYQCDVHCDRKCVEYGRANDLCIALRGAIDKNLYLLK